MKTQLKLIVAAKITELEVDRRICIANAKDYFANCDILDGSITSKVNFFGLNKTKTHIRKLDNKLKNLREVQITLKKSVFTTV